MPSEATFSRAFAQFAEMKLPEVIHEELIKKYESPRLIGHISRDSTEIEARERAAKKAKKQKLPKRKRGRPKKGEERVKKVKPVTRLARQQEMTLEQMLDDLPRVCDSGSKLLMICPESVTAGASSTAKAIRNSGRDTNYI